ncbi:MAG: hypothetical protein Q8M03_04710 [Legionella sp.]|nr:hypothetical protein [Legionella sp.]
MPSQNDLYNNAVQWINENPGDKSIPEELKQDLLRFNTLQPKNKIQLLITLNRLLYTTGLPQEIEKSLPSLMDTLPDELFLQIRANIKKESDLSNLVATSQSIHSLFQTPRLSDKFLQRVAYGEQDKVERLFKNIYKNDTDKIQTALRYKGEFTDYSGRTFHCTAYEYAYWAKDTHMCRMLEQHMNEETKAEMLERCVAIEDNGLEYIQDKKKKNSPHFDLTLLQTALTIFIGKAKDANSESKELLLAWMNVFNTQRDVPAHVAHEYCRPDRAFSPLPEFNEPSLPRVLLIGDSERGGAKNWFPLDGYIDVITRWKFPVGAVTLTMARALDNELSKLKIDLEAIKQLDNVRTADLTQSRDNLTKVTPASGLQPSQ